MPGCSSCRVARPPGLRRTDGHHQTAAPTTWLDLLQGLDDRRRRQLSSSSSPWSGGAAGMRAAAPVETRKSREIPQDPVHPHPHDHDYEGARFMSWSASDIPDQSGRLAVVTGANGGLGLETARELARNGAHVVMAVRNQQKAQEAVQNIRA